MTVSAPSFSQQKTNGVMVQVNEVTELNPHLATGSETTAVEVTADPPMLKFDRPSTAATWTRKRSSRFRSTTAAGRRWR